MENIVIKNISYEKTGKRIIEYFKSLGVDTEDILGTISEKSSCKFFYYGVINGKFGNYSLAKVQECKAKIIELPEVFEPKRGDRVLVWDEDESKTEEAIFITEVKGSCNPFIVVYKLDEKKFLNGEKFEVMAYKNMKQIQPQFVYLSFEDISNGEGVGVPPELIRIKK